MERTSQPGRPQVVPCVYTEAEVWWGYGGGGGVNGSKVVLAEVQQRVQDRL